MENEFIALVALVDQLGLAAEAHDTGCTTSCGEDNHECFDNRLLIAGLVLQRLGLELCDIGFVADKLLELQCEAGTQTCGECNDEWPATVVDTEH